MNSIRYRPSYILATALVAAMISSGCGGGSSPVSVSAPDTQGARTSEKVSKALKTSNGTSDITYAITLSESSYNQQSDTTDFTYEVVSNPEGGPAIGHWLILVPNECTEKLVVINSSDPTAKYGPDGSTGYTGIKFDTSYQDGEFRFVNLTLDGQWWANEVNIVVKAGNGFEPGIAGGPVCYPPGPLEATKITSISPDTAGLFNDPATGWSYAGFVGIEEFTVLAHVMNYGLADWSNFTENKWKLGNAFNGAEVLYEKRPVVFVVINWGRFLEESGFGSVFPGYVDGDTSFAGATFSVTYNNGTVNGKNVNITIPPVSVPADFAPKYWGLGNPFLDIQRSVVFYIDEFGNAAEIHDADELRRMYEL